MAASVKVVIAYEFDCPLHGPETAVMCFRAFDPANRHLWTKYEATMRSVMFDAGELERVVTRAQA